MKRYDKRFNLPAYGGQDWSPRISSHRDEIGEIWTKCGINSEWAPLKSVLLHNPGPEIEGITNPEDSLMLQRPRLEVASAQHEKLAQAYSSLGINVHHVQPDRNPSPNLMFCADLLFMTPEGAILARPASTHRAGEERWVARRLADLGIPILRTITNLGVFEGADALWLDAKTVVIGIGLRTNVEAATQVKETLMKMGVETIFVDLPVGTMHLMGILRFLDEETVLTWPYRLAWKALLAFKDRNINVQYIPDEQESIINGALNFVTIKPKEIIIAAGNPITQEFLENFNVRCHPIEVGELYKAAGGIGCLTAVLEREIV